MERIKKTMTEKSTLLQRFLKKKKTIRIGHVANVIHELFTWQCDFGKCLVTLKTPTICICNKLAIQCLQRESRAQVKFFLIFISY